MIFTCITFLALVKLTEHIDEELKLLKACTTEVDAFSPNNAVSPYLLIGLHRVISNLEFNRNKQSIHAADQIGKAFRTPPPAVDIDHQHIWSLFFHPFDTGVL